MRKTDGDDVDSMRREGYARSVHLDRAARSDSRVHGTGPPRRRVAC